MQMKVANPEAPVSTAEVAERAGVHKDTLLRWLRRGLIVEPSRDRHGWRSFSAREAEAVIAFARKSPESAPLSVPLSGTLPPGFAVLKGIDWDFAGAKTNYLTHGIHPYVSISAKLR